MWARKVREGETGSNSKHTESRGADERWWNKEKGGERKEKIKWRTKKRGEREVGMTKRKKEDRIKKK